MNNFIVYGLHPTAIDLNKWEWILRNTHDLDAAMRYAHKVGKAYPHLYVILMCNGEPMLFYRNNVPLVKPELDKIKRAFRTAVWINYNVVYAADKE